MTASQGNRIAVVMTGVGVLLLGLVVLLGPQETLYAGALLASAIASGAIMYLAMHAVYTQTPFKDKGDLGSADEYIAFGIMIVLLAASLLLTKQVTGPALPFQGMEYLALPASLLGCEIGAMRARLEWEHKHP